MKRAGIIPDPEITTKSFYVDPSDPSDGATIVLATDGVWDVLNATSVLDIVQEEMHQQAGKEQWDEVNCAENAARAVVDKAREKWRGPFMDVKIDDATCIVFSSL
uniref:PPM-type phosphatase domain-containing protein n=1 Tax=Leptocylindrus danicus TaxID=163516 RepID=A0A7S2P8L0_9STRA|mmetsp:Transcript_24813/g.37168  ORF Transcript_24813/g.37168 Transcript_24813/m.37168 type:complete len:105 (+) Transcript_24813:2-316(+)